MPDTKSKRCVSGCKSLEESICTRAPRCTYSNGQTRKYCRLGKGFKMQKQTCKVIKKIKKVDARNKIGRFILENNRSIKNRSEEKTRKNASRKIAKFFKNTSEKRTSEFLKSICSDSGACIAFGTNRHKITKFFDGFTDFKYVEPPIKRIGKPSANGFVNEIKYKKSGYTAYAVLKSSTRPSADNLVYEYIVGQFINKQCNYFPCFLETYGFYFYNDNEKWNNINHINYEIMN